MHQNVCISIEIRIFSKFSEFLKVKKVTTAQFNRTLKNNNVKVF